MTIRKRRLKAKIWDDGKPIFKEFSDDEESLFTSLKKWKDKYKWALLMILEKMSKKR